MALGNPHLEFEISVSEILQNLEFQFPEIELGIPDMKNVIGFGFPNMEFGIPS